MVRLKNIKKSDSAIECDILPEDSEQMGHVVVGAGSGELLEYNLPAGYEWCRNHVNHAQDELLKLLNERDMPNEKVVMWY